MMFYATLRRFIRYDSDTFRYDSLIRWTRSFGRNRNDFTIGVLVNRFGIDNSRAVEEYELEEGEIVDEDDAAPIEVPARQQTVNKIRYFPIFAYILKNVGC